mmetsp:Transcript_4126/g.5426  ORF Transcript_4126/g.5426 Transcript_4126/m.5426 type:complete len:281 (+) Transcript_4126:103-945(+)
MSEFTAEDVFHAIESDDLIFLSSVCDEEGFNSQIDEAGNSPIHAAVLKGNIHIIRFIVEGTNCKLNDKNTLAQTPLHLAISNGSLDIVSYLLAHGSSPQEKNVYGVNALHLAVTTNSYQISKALLHKANSEIVSLRTEEGESVISLACENGSWELVDLVLGYVGRFAFREDINPTNGKSPLHSAVCGGNEVVVENLISEVGCDVNAVDLKGDSPLHWACDLGKLEVVKVLIELGNADINLQDLEGDTPLSIAQMRARSDIAEYLSDVMPEEIEIITLEQA